MQIRSLKQALHWVFLALGLVSVLVLALSVSTYLDYARDGYGLNVSVTDARLAADGRLVLTIEAENPGGLDLYIGGPEGESGNMTVGGVSRPLSLNDFVLIEAGKVTRLEVSAYLGQEEREAIRSGGAADILVNMPVTIPERDARTNIRLELAGLEVVA